MKISNYLRYSLLTLLLISSTTMAADIARDVRIGETAPYSRDGGFFEVGAGLGVFSHPVVGEDEGVGFGVFLAGIYQWHGLFVESIDGSSTDIAVGYNAWNNRNWSLDLIASSLNANIVSDDNQKLRGLEEREGDVLLGARATGYFGNYIFQLQLLDGISNVHDGVIASIEAGRSWQVRNWNYHTVLGIRSHEKQVVDYYLGVTPKESQATGLREFKANAGSYLTAEIGATYPMSEHWVFRGTASILHLDNNLSDSPIIRKENSGDVFATISYVF